MATSSMGKPMSYWHISAFLLSSCCFLGCRCWICLAVHLDILIYASPSEVFLDSLQSFPAVEVPKCLHNMTLPDNFWNMAGTWTFSDLIHLPGNLSLSDLWPWLIQRRASTQAGSLSPSIYRTFLSKWTSPSIHEGGAPFPRTLRRLTSCHCSSLAHLALQDTLWPFWTVLGKLVSYPPSLFYLYTQQSIRFALLYSLLDSYFCWSTRLCHDHSTNGLWLDLLIGGMSSSLSCSSDLLQHQMPRWGMDILITWPTIATYIR